jgi:prepilin-type N-terminal cleavage/methylation domain-containing protein
MLLMKKTFLNVGFTLVELLVVVALIAVLAVAVLSTINPIEQTNRARDAKFRNDAAEIVNAAERYFTVKSYFPWSHATYCGTGAIVAGDPLPWTDGSGGAVGICAANGVCSSINAGCLITDYELKSEFADRSSFKAAAGPLDRFYAGRQTGSGSTFYVCYVPKSQARRSSFSKLKATIVVGNSVAEPLPACGLLTTTGNYTTLLNSCLECVPSADF